VIRRRVARLTVAALATSASVVASSGMTAAGTGASSPVAASCLIEKVVLQPVEKPQTAQVIGACAVALSATLYEPYGDAERGYLYYFLPADNVEVTRREWADLSTLAGKAEGASFGDRTRGLPRLRPIGETPTNPDEYTIGIGVVRLGPSVLLDHLKRALRGG
jgi:hypothetical protein